MTSHDLPQGITENTISLLFGHPDPATLLTPELRNAMQRVISSPQAYTALQYGPEQGTHSLIDFLVEKINREQEPLHSACQSDGSCRLDPRRRYARAAVRQAGRSNAG